MRFITNFLLAAAFAAMAVVAVGCCSSSDGNVLPDVHDEGAGGNV